MKEDKQLLAKMMEDIQSLDKIAVLKEENNVIRKMLRGVSKTQILKDLKQDHPYENITMRDLDSFLILYKDILYNEKTDIEKGYVRRLLKSKEGLTNELADLALKAKHMTDKYDAEGDNGNAVAALRTAADIFMKFAKVEGLAVDRPEINVNMQMDKVVSQITTQDSEFKKSILKIVNGPQEESETIEAEVVYDEEDNE
jgi:hypothetical protein